MCPEKPRPKSGPETDSAVSEFAGATDSADNESAQEESVLRSIRRITRAIDLYSRKLSASCDLTGPQLACLRQLARFGEVPTTQIAEAVSLSPATVTGILDRLEQAGLVTRERHQDDKRRVIVDLTPKGRSAVLRAPPPLQDTFTQRFRNLAAERQSQLDRALQEIVAMMEAGDIDASPLLIPADEPGRSADAGETD